MISQSPAVTLRTESPAASALASEAVGIRYLGLPFCELAEPSIALGSTHSATGIHGVRATLRLLRGFVPLYARCWGSHRVLCRSGSLDIAFCVEDSCFWEELGLVVAVWGRGNRPVLGMVAMGTGWWRWPKEEISGVLGCLTTCKASCSLYDKFRKGSRH